MRASSGCGEQGYSSCGTWASPRSGFSSRTQALGAWAPVVPAQVEHRPWVHGLPWSQLRWNAGPGCMGSRGPSSGGTQALGAWAPVVPAQVERRPWVRGLPWSQLWWNTGPRCMGSCGSSTTAQWLLCTSFSCSTEHGIFLDQGLNPSPLHWQADSCSLYHLKQWF